LKEGFIETNTMTTLLTSVTTVLSSAATWVGSIGTMIVDNPILLISFVLGLTLSAIGIFKALRH